MVRTGARAAILEDLLLKGGLKLARTPASPRVTDLDEKSRDEVVSLYRRLGGAQETPTFRPGAWDLSFEGGLVVELDEELHFNRYRAMTLEAPWAADLPWTQDYERFCKACERDCLAAGSWGKRWTNPSCERMFGAPGPPKELVGPGAPRWKQRALYDAIKDLGACLNDGLRLARVSVHDKVDGVSVGGAVEGHGVINADALASFVIERSV